MKSKRGLSLSQKKQVVLMFLFTSVQKQAAAQSRLFYFSFGCQLGSNLVTSLRGDACMNSEKKAQFSGFEVAAVSTMEARSCEWKDCGLIPLSAHFSVNCEITLLVFRLLLSFFSFVCLQFYFPLAFVVSFLAILDFLFTKHL